MASQSRKPALPGTSSNNEGILARVSSTVSQSPIVYQGKVAASNVSYVTKRLAKSTGKAAWYFGTTLLVLVVPLVILMDRETQMSDFDLQQASLLGTAALSPPK